MTLEVCDSGQEPFDLLLEKSDCPVTARTKQFTFLVRLVIMIKRQKLDPTVAGLSFRPMTDCAESLLFFEQGLIQGFLFRIQIAMISAFAFSQSIDAKANESIAVGSVRHLPIDPHPQFQHGAIE